MSIGPQTPYRRKNLADISYIDRVIAHFASNFVAMATGVFEQKCNRQHCIQWPITENTPIDAKISQKSRTETEL